MNPKTLTMQASATPRLNLAPRVAPRGCLAAPCYPRSLASSSRGAGVRTLTASRPRATRRRAAIVTALFERFTERSIKAVMLAQDFARNGVGAAEVGTEHILLGLIAEEAATAGNKGFLGSDVAVDRARAAVDAVLGQPARRDAPAKDLPFTRGSKDLLERALQESRKMGMSFITPEHLALAALEAGGDTSRAVLDRLGADCAALREEALRRIRVESEGDQGAKQAAAAGAANAPRSAAAVGAASGERKKSPALDEFCRDLVAEALAGRIDPVIGRDFEVARVAQILARRSKNNPILLGEPGVGKTAIAEGLARAIAQRASVGGAPLPAFLLGKRVMSLDVGLLMAGAKERGELESRVTKLLAECQADGNVILVIDEIHTLVGAGAGGSGRGGGGGGGGLDIANLLKPALARGGLQCIGATTLAEHRQYIEKDAALERRFQPVLVGEPGEAAAHEVLIGLAPVYERHHRVAYDPEALAAAVRLSSRYIADRQLPDKAIDVMDEAGSRVRIAAYGARRAAAEGALEAATAAYGELASVAETKELMARDELYEEAALLRSRELGLRASLGGAPEQPGCALPVVTVAHVEEVVAAWSGVPVQAMAQDERTRLAGLDGALRERVVGQEEAVQAAARAMQRSASGLRDPRRPIGAMLFAGPTGVGKTELTRALAQRYFGSEDAMIRLDMSEYMERHTVSKLVGAPPGYVGFGEGGKLTEAVRRRPFSLVLFDEIEKAHPDVFNMLLQVLEDGRLTDSQGRTVSFKHALVVLTSNVGSAAIAKGGSGLGFQLGGAAEAAEAGYLRTRSLVMEELKAVFRPELLNRLDEVVVFRPLGAEHAAAIAGLELEKTAQRLAERGVGLEVTDAALAAVVADGYSASMGARELRRAVMRLVDDELSDALLTGRVVAGQVAVVDVAPGSSAGRLAVVEKSCHVVAALAAQAAVEYSGANA